MFTVWRDASGDTDHLSCAGPLALGRLHAKANRQARRDGSAPPQDQSDQALPCRGARMIFASFEFLFLFLPAFFAAYFLTPARLRNWPILLLSWGFYAWWRVDFLALLVGVTAFTFTVVRGMDAVGPRSTAGRRLLLLGLFGNLGVLAYFKYANFGVSSFNQLLAGLGLAPMGWSEIMLPIGLSFYVLQSVSYLVDVHRGDVPVSRNFVNYAAYKAIFSQLIAGPIVRYAEIERE